MENEKRLINADANDCIQKVKRKTHFAKIIVSGTAEKPYYDIMWFDYMDREYHIGYGSYNLNFVFQWLSECFEIVDAPTVDAVEVVHGQWLDNGMCNHKPSRFRNPDKWTIYKCSQCGYSNGRRKNANYCPNCGAKMDGDGNGQ